MTKKELSYLDAMLNDTIPFTWDVFTLMNTVKLMRKLLREYQKAKPPQKK